jgi:hypothetical protein
LKEARVNLLRALIRMPTEQALAHHRHAAVVQVDHAQEPIALG